MRRAGDHVATAQSSGVGDIPACGLAFYRPATCYDDGFPGFIEGWSRCLFETGGATPTPEVCGIDQNYQSALVTVSDPIGVRNLSTPAMTSFFHDVMANKTLRADARGSAGVVEVFGGSGNVNDGIKFATGAIASLKAHSNGQFIFSARTGYFKPLWDGTIQFNQVRIFVFYYILATSCGSR